MKPASGALYMKAARGLKGGGGAPAVYLGIYTILSLSQMVGWLGFEGHRIRGPSRARPCNPKTALVCFPLTPIIVFSIIHYLIQHIGRYPLKLK